MKTLQKTPLALAIPSVLPAIPASTPRTVPVQPAKERFLRLPEVMTRTGLGKSSIYALQASKQFPASVRIGPRCVAWLESSIDAWIQARIALQAEQEQQQ